MSKERLQITIDKDLYEAIKKLPREISVSDVFNILLKVAIEEIKLGHEMSDKELIRWSEKDKYRKEVRKYLQKRLGPYIDLLKDVKTRVIGKVRVKGQ